MHVLLDLRIFVRRERFGGAGTLACRAGTRLDAWVGTRPTDLDASVRYVSVAAPLPCGAEINDLHPCPGSAGAPW